MQQPGKRCFILMTGKVDQRNRTVRVCACAPIRAVGERKEGGGGGRWGGGDRRRNRGRESERVPLQLCPGVPPATQLQLQIKQNRVAAGAAPRH